MVLSTCDDCGYQYEGDVCDRCGGPLTDDDSNDEGDYALAGGTEGGWIIGFNSQPPINVDNWNFIPFLSHPGFGVWRYTGND